MRPGLYNVHGHGGLHCDPVELHFSHRVNSLLARFSSDRNTHRRVGAAAAVAVAAAAQLAPNLTQTSVSSSFFYVVKYVFLFCEVQFCRETVPISWLAPDLLMKDAIVE